MKKLRTELRSENSARFVADRIELPQESEAVIAIDVLEVLLRAGVAKLI